MTGHVYFFDIELNQFRQLQADEFFIVQPATDFATQFCGGSYGPDAPDVLFREI